MISKMEGLTKGHAVHNHCAALPVRSCGTKVLLFLELCKGLCEKKYFAKEQGVKTKSKDL